MSLTPAPIDLDPQLLEILACPSADHAPLRLEPPADGAAAGASGELVCTVCLTRYPVIGGIPVLLVDDATPGPRGIGVAAELP